MTKDVSKDDVLRLLALSRWEKRGKKGVEKSAKFFCEI